jgi:hypothetical protein
VQNNATRDDDIVSIFDCLDENLLEVKYSDNQDSYYRSGTSGSEKSDWHITPVVSGWRDVNWQMKI